VRLRTRDMKGGTFGHKVTFGLRYVSENVSSREQISLREIALRAILVVYRDQKTIGTLLSEEVILWANSPSMTKGLGFCLHTFIIFN
jgi:hypothetical protein